MCGSLNFVGILLKLLLWLCKLEVIMLHILSMCHHKLIFNLSVVSWFRMFHYSMNYVSCIRHGDKVGCLLASAFLLAQSQSEATTMLTLVTLWYSWFVLCINSYSDLFFTLILPRLALAGALCIGCVIFHFCSLHLLKYGSYIGSHK